MKTIGWTIVLAGLILTGCKEETMTPDIQDIRGAWQVKEASSKKEFHLIDYAHAYTVINNDTVSYFFSFPAGEDHFYLTTMNFDTTYKCKTVYHINNDELELDNIPGIADESEHLWFNRVSQ